MEVTVPSVAAARLEGDPMIPRRMYALCVVVMGIGHESAHRYRQPISVTMPHTATIALA